MQNKHITINEFSNLYLSRKQLSILRCAAKTGKPSKEVPPLPKELFEGINSEESTTFLEYFGVVPEDVRYLADIDFLSPLDPDKNPITNDNQDKCYIITETGKQYLRYKRNKLLPVFIIPIIVALAAVAGVIVSALK